MVESNAVLLRRILNLVGIKDVLLEYGNSSEDIAVFVNIRPYQRKRFMEVMEVMSAEHLSKLILHIILITPTDRVVMAVINHPNKFEVSRGFLITPRSMYADMPFKSSSVELICGAMNAVFNEVKLKREYNK